MALTGGAFWSVWKRSPANATARPAADLETARLIQRAQQARSPESLRRVLLPAAALAAPVDVPAADNPAAPPQDASSQPAQVAAAFLRLPPEERTRLAEQIVDDLTDAQFPRLLPLLTFPQMPEEVLDVLMADALTRRNGLSLPAMLEVKRVPDHPKAGDALEILELYLEADYGDDVDAWQAALAAWLAAHPDPQGN